MVITTILVKQAKIIIFSIVIFSFLTGLYFYPQMPDKIASHWNAAGVVDGYMSKFLGLFLMPFVSLVMALLFTWLPKIDPLKGNVKKFRSYFDVFIIFLLAFLFYIYSLTILWNLGQEFNMTYAIIPPIAVLSYAIGLLVEKSKRNWFIGIRTPWTLSSDKVWESTSKLGGKLFKACSLIILFGIFFSDYAIYFAIVPLTIVSLFTVVYSYFEYKKEEKRS